MNTAEILTEFAKADYEAALGVTVDACWSSITNDSQGTCEFLMKDGSFIVFNGQSATEAFNSRGSKTKFKEAAARAPWNHSQKIKWWHGAIILMVGPFIQYFLVPESSPSLIAMFHSTWLFLYIWAGLIATDKRYRKEFNDWL